MRRSSKLATPVKLVGAIAIALVVVQGLRAVVSGMESAFSDLSSDLSRDVGGVWISSACLGHAVGWMTVWTVCADVPFPFFATD